MEGLASEVRSMLERLDPAVQATEAAVLIRTATIRDIADLLRRIASVEAKRDEDTIGVALERLEILRGKYMDEAKAAKAKRNAKGAAAATHAAAVMKAAITSVKDALS